MRTDMSISDVVVQKLKHLSPTSVALTFISFLCGENENALLKNNEINIYLT